MSVKKSKSFGTMHPLKPHLLQQTGGLAAEIKDVRDDVETAFKNSEGRSGFPELDWLDGGAVAAAGGDAVLIGRNLLQGQTFDSLAHGTGNSLLTFTCLKPGASGFSIAVLAGDTGTVLGATFTGGVLTVQLAEAGNTATEVATEVNKAGSVVKGIIRAVKGGTGGGAVTAMAVTAMAGGAGLYTGNAVTVSGVEALPAHATGDAPAATWTDTSITATVPALTGATPARAAGDIVAAVIQSDGLKTQSLSFALA